MEINSTVTYKDASRSTVEDILSEYAKAENELTEKRIKLQEIERSGLDDDYFNLMLAKIEYGLKKEEYDYLRKKLQKIDMFY